MKAALLPDRGVIKVAGPDDRKFLNGLVTTDLAKVAPGRPRADNLRHVWTRITQFSNSGHQLINWQAIDRTTDHLTIL